MITRRDATKEMLEARKILQDEKVPVEKKLKAIGKLAEITLKVALDNRTNTVRVMEKLEVEKVKVRKPKENAEKTEESKKE